MTQPPENGPDEQTQPYGALPSEAPEPHPVAPPPQQPSAPPKSSNTRTILEIVGAVVAVGAIFVAGALGFGMGWFAGTHHRNNVQPRMIMGFDDGQNDRGGNGFGFPGDGNDGQSAPGMPNWRDFFGQGGPNSDGSNPFGDNGSDGSGGGTQSMPQLPDELQRWLEQFGQSLGGDSGGGFGPGQGQGPRTAPAAQLRAARPVPHPPADPAEFERSEDRLTR